MAIWPCGTRGRGRSLRRCAIVELDRRIEVDDLRLDPRSRLRLGDEFGRKPRFGGCTILPEVHAAEVVGVDRVELADQAGDLLVGGHRCGKALLELGAGRAWR